MGKIIAICNQKGGVGKTTTCINLGYSLALLGRNTLLVDLDPQANCTSGLGAAKSECSVLDLLNGRDVIPTCVFDNLHLLPSCQDLLGLEVELANIEGREFMVKNKLDSIKDLYDIILLDTPPSLGILALNALTAADYCLVPVQAEYYALEGLASITKTVEFIKNTSNPRLKIIGFVVTMFDSRTVLSKQVFDEIRQSFGDLVFDIKIPRSVRVAEAPSFGKPLLQYDSGNIAGLAYLNLADKLIQRLDMVQVGGEATKRVG